MNITAKMYVRLWNGEAGRVLSVVGSKLNVLLSTGVRKCVEATQVVEAESNEKFELAQKRLQSFKTKQSAAAAAEPDEWNLDKREAAVVDNRFGQRRSSAESFDATFAGLTAVAVKNEDVINMFVQDSFPKDKMPQWGTDNLKITKEQGGWSLVNYHTPILFRNDKTGEVFFNTSKYSQTTSKIQGIISRSLSSAGVSATEVDEAGIDKARDAAYDIFEAKKAEGSIKTASYDDWVKELDAAGESVPLTKDEFDSYVKNTGKVPSVSDALSWKGVEAAKTAGHPQDLVNADAKYHLGDILIPAENADEGDIGQAMHILDIKTEDKVYVVEKRPNVDDKEREKSETFGVRFEIPISTLDKDTAWVKFAAKTVAALSQDAVIESLNDYETMVFQDMLKSQSGDKDKALEILVNQVEGDTSQLSDQLAAYAKQQGWLEGFEVGGAKKAIKSPVRTHRDYGETSFRASELKKSAAISAEERATYTTFAKGLKKALEPFMGGNDFRVRTLSSQRPNPYIEVWLPGFMPGGSDGIPNDFRKKVMDAMGWTPLNPENINYGNIVSNRIALHYSEWLQVLAALGVTVPEASASSSPSSDTSSELEVTSVKADNGVTVFTLKNGCISFDAEGKATATVAGVTDAQIAEFGKMVKTFGAEKIASMVSIKRLQQKKAVLAGARYDDNPHDVNYKGYLIFHPVNWVMRVKSQEGKWFIGVKSKDREQYFVLNKEGGSGVGSSEGFERAITPDSMTFDSLQSAKDYLDGKIASKRLQKKSAALETKAVNKEEGTGRHIKISFSQTTPESAEDGDFSDTGWKDEEGESMEPDESDKEEGLTAVDKAVKFLQDEGAFYTSSTVWHPGLWYSTPMETISYETGTEEEKSFHLYNFTEDEERQIFEKFHNQKRGAKKDDSKGTDATKDALQKNALFEVKEMPGNEGVKAQGGPIEVKQKGTRFTPKTLRDHALLRQLIGTPYFAEKDYDKVLEIVSKVGYGITTHDYNDVMAAKPSHGKGEVKVIVTGDDLAEEFLADDKLDDKALEAQVLEKFPAAKSWVREWDWAKHTIGQTSEPVMARLQKKAARLGTWDFDKHEPVWKLEAGDDGKKRLVRTTV